MALLLLLLVDALVTAVCIDQSYLRTSLLPANAAPFPWRLPLASEGRNRQARVDLGNDRLRFDFRLASLGAGEGEYASADLHFIDRNGAPALIDLSRYSAVELVAKCSPANALTMVIPTFDEQFSRRGELLTYPSPQTFFACNEQGVRNKLNLAHMNIPQWWFDMLKQDISHQMYKLERVAKIGFGTSSQSPRNVDSYVEISELSLNGRDYRYIAGLVVFLVVGGVAFGVWFFFAHARALLASLNTQLKQDLPLMAYRQLTLEPYRDKEKAAVLRFIASNYANAELDLETVVAETAVNRKKVNEVLKAELGMTFSAYLNKLRLTEAARLLADSNTATVAEIAYSVGYANVSYFNKLFKDEYGCTPKAFRSLALQSAEAG
ncbi:helix-turn-helix domain-containing protein [Duganella radicis]|uniref:helix-turn-helix domain-containing protein n=1 Tax=Duganella radicis TaxID=551988 RepID=UPI0035308E84